MRRRLSKKRCVAGTLFWAIPLVGLLLVAGAGARALAGQYDLNLIDTPKTYTSYKGEIHFDFTMYDMGGILTGATLGLSDNFLLGVYFDVGQLIGSEEAQVNQPGVLARFLVSDGSTFFPPIAIGYSYFMKGEVHKVNGVTVSGLYVVGSARYFFLKNEQSFTYGIRYPIVPIEYSRPENFSIFFGTDIELSPSFGVKAEIENIRIADDWWRETFYNLAFGFNIIDVLALSLELKYSPSIDRVVRLLRIGYTTQF
jgi:hypothetical protein